MRNDRSEGLTVIDMDDPVRPSDDSTVNTKI